MNKTSKNWLIKLVLIILFITLCVLVILPSIGEKKMKVVFNSNVTLEQMDQVRHRFKGDSYKITENNKEFIIKSYRLNDAVMNELKIYPGVADAVILQHWTEKYLLAKKIKLGLDLQGGTYLVLQPDYKSIIEKKKIQEDKKEIVLSEADKGEMISQAMEIITSRVNQFGVSEPLIRRRGNEAIEVQLPGVKDPAAVKQLIGYTGTVEYRLVNDEFTYAADGWLANNIKTPIPEDDAGQKVLLAQISDGIKLPADQYEALFSFERDQNNQDRLFPNRVLILEKKIALAGDDINNAFAETDERGMPCVGFTTTQQGAEKFAAVTNDANKGKRLAIVIDDKIRSAPAINSQIKGGRAQITGSFTSQEVDMLKKIIKEGALPVKLLFVEERTVGPTLGQDSISAGIKALVVGMLGIMLFMVIYYKAAGMVANLCLILNLILMVAVLQSFKFTLTMPGMAGLLLTLGMAVDANVLIFERIKEELRLGKSVRTAVTLGYERAFWSIFDSNLTTLLGGFILVQLGTGPVKGFAVTLIIGIICSMFTALYVSKVIYMLITSNKNLKKLSI